MAKEKIFIVEAPVENYCGIGAAGVHFAYGKAEVREGWVLDWFRKHGYKVTEKAEEAAGGGEKSLDKMKVDELKAYAAEKNIDLTGADKKDDIIAAIKAAEEAAGGGQ